MRITGKIPFGERVQALPIESPMYSVGGEIQRNYRGGQSLSFTYESDAELLAQLVPECFEIDEHPVVTFSFSQTDYSLAGAYLMANLGAEVYLNNKKMRLDLRQFITSTVPIVVGRELLGVAKVDGHIEIHRGASSPLVSASLSRPSHHLLASAVFEPREYLGIQERSTSQRLGVRAIPGLSPSGLPDICEITQFASESWGSDAWSGAGTLKFTEASDIDPIHLAPVRKMVSCRYAIGGWSKTTITRGNTIKI